VSQKVRRSVFSGGEKGRIFRFSYRLKSSLRTEVEHEREGGVSNRRRQRMAFEKEEKSSKQPEKKRTVSYLKKGLLREEKVPQSRRKRETAQYAGIKSGLF